MDPTPKILYIDDEADLLDLAVSFFEDENMMIDTCTNFQAALEMIKLKKYDLIISDERMPSGSGHELMAIIKSENIFQGKTIMVTGNIDSSGEQHDKGYDLILFKPLHFQELIDHVKKILLV